MTWLRFQVPAPLLPARVERGRLVAKITGSAGRLEIAASRNGDTVPLKTWFAPAGILTLEIADPNVLALSADGGLFLRVSGGDPDQDVPLAAASTTGKASLWRIESLSLEVRIQTAAVATPIELNEIP
jgi:hypothetical protein